MARLVAAGPESGRTALVLIAAALALGAGAACERRLEPPAAVQESAAFEPWRCSPGFTEPLRLATRAPMQERVAPALRALAAGCPQLGVLAVAAGRAAALERTARSRLLAQAVAPLLPPGCVPAPNPSGPAADVARACPMGLELSPGLLQDLDAGTYLFALTVRRRLLEAGELDAAGARLLDDLLLAAALEGEAQR